MRTARQWFLPMIMAALAVPTLAAQPLPYESMAARIAAALQVTAGERVLLRFDPNIMGPLAPAVRSALEAHGAMVNTLPYGPAPDFDATLAQTDIYVWLPAPGSATSADQRRALERWIDNGPGRELHFHWIDGTRDVDGLPAPHTPAYDRVYVEALDVDYQQLADRMEQVIRRLRAGEVRVTTASGTDVRFRVGDRPFNKQDGDASKAHARVGRIRIDRETELPAGILRVAPLEESMTGVIVLPSARFGSERATEVRLEFQNGVATHAQAGSGNEAVQAFLKSDTAASRFREFCLGFNPKLIVPPGESALPYYGYGSGVVRLSLGDNTELGGSVRGGVSRWLFFPDATVRVGADVIVRDGKLQ
jgi:aminopeptidase